ncbi:MAG: LysR family transcriptional regulator [Defluviimonas sp.]|uniref:LysR family transcriptional regulator n=1 Tax=Albidovulum sp. TaxID=1872424 RepID=UPI001E09067B|nr:LysR family transcriptional regulator [Paracoccaceae bacterium]MCC0063718.1 LysR family transcriptional regulator [Defluviimonas sp.]
MLRYTLRQLEYFVAVGEAGSIALASERVNISSPSISAAIAQLEREFGLPLFVRHHAQGLAPTLAGRRMLEQARLVLVAAEALGDLAGDLTGSARGTISVGCLTTIAQFVLPALRRGFETLYPEIRLRHHAFNQAELFSALRRARIDVALTYDLEIPADLTFAPLIDLPPYAMVDADHPLAGRATVSLTELARFPMVLLDLPLSADYFLSIFGRAGLRPMIAERSRDLSIVRSLVGNGFGYSIANVRPPNDRAPDGRPLGYIALEGKPRPMRLGLLTARDGGSLFVVRAFMDHARSRIEARDLPGLGGAA